MSERLRRLDDDLRPNYQGFHDLMNWRVERILLVASLYDSFVLEEDGRLTERIFGDYTTLSLSYPPRVTPVRSVAKALEALDEVDYDLVVTMLRLPDQDTASFVREVKRRHPGLPVALMTSDAGGLQRRRPQLRRAGVDLAFLWSGDASIFLALIKSIEDRANLDFDVSRGDVRIVVLVEDSVRYYSQFLPILYREIMVLTQALIDEGLNEYHQFFRRRARPKVVLAQTFEDALSVFRRYPDNVLGFLSDISFPHGGEKVPDAGFQLVKAVRELHEDIPFLLLSAEPHNARRARQLNTSFLDKNSPTLARRLREFITGHLGFGDFVFRRPDGQEEGRASDLPRLIELVEKVSSETLLYHARGNHFSHWLAARGEFALARALRPEQPTEGELRPLLLKALTGEQDRMQRGAIADLRGQHYNPTRNFTRLGTGSLGGKSRSVAFLGALLKRAGLDQAHPKVKVGVPQSVALGVDVFERFVEHNGLDWLATAQVDDARVAAEFLQGDLPEEVKENLVRVLNVIQEPLAVRSSSLLEDSTEQPFAGVFKTTMLPNTNPNVHQRLYELCRAVKLVFASTWFSAARSYLRATGHNPLDQKMGVLIQRVVGRTHGELFYPCISGVAQTHNFYPVRYMQAEDGVAQIALGLGTTITDGGIALRFCPKHPQVLPQLISPAKALDATQKRFYALDLNAESEVTAGTPPVVQRDLLAAEGHGTLANLASVYCPQDDRLRDGVSARGPRVLTFAPILKWGVFPLAELLDTILERARRAMSTPAEIEFSAVVSGPRPELRLLQIRPVTVLERSEVVRLDGFAPEELLLDTTRALGHGLVEGLRDIVYVRPEAFSRTLTREIAREVARCNEVLEGEERPYLLIGPGRWGTSDPFVGIPVRWDEVSGARVIVEADLPNFEVEPSQGSHFFHNLTAFRVFLLTVSFRRPEERIDWAWLDALEPAWSGRYVRRLALDRPLRVVLDGRSNRGIIVKPRSAAPEA